MRQRENSCVLLEKRNSWTAGGRKGGGGTERYHCVALCPERENGEASGNEKRE